MPVEFFADLEQDINRLSTRTVLIAAAALVVLVVAAIMLRKHKKLAAMSRVPLFTLMVFTIVTTTLALFSSTIYLNVRSDSGGPVHWHADIEFWACDTELALRNPSGFLSNKIGTSTYHEHNDKRIHLEGVVVDKEVDASLGKFLEVVGGHISHDGLVLPVTDEIFEDEIDGDQVESTSRLAVESFVATDAKDKKILRVESGQTCVLNQATLQTFVYRFDEKTRTYAQTKLSDPAAYVIRDESVVPPGDCIIVEFNSERQTTDKLCQQYGVRDRERCASFGVEADKRELCDIQEASRGRSN
jgi:hypothetical protein